MIRVIKIEVWYLCKAMNSLTSSSWWVSDDDDDYDNHDDDCDDDVVMINLLSMYCIHLIDINDQACF